VAQPPFAKRFFMGVPAPAAALTAGVPLYLWLHFGPGWWSSKITVALWALLVAGLMVSRIPTLSLKSVRVQPRLIAPLLVLVGVVAAILLTAPFLGMAMIAAGYVALAPVTILRYRWLSQHPEAWGVPPRERRAVARAARSARRLGLRPPLRRRVAGRASGVMRAAVRRLGPDGGSPQNGAPSNGSASNGTASRPGGQGVPSANRRRLGLRRR
jgi:CDP-diacylglycerol--serine O-phosphatidyltransferase